LIKQFNAVYSRPEDRILLRLTTTDDAELRLWLTRAVFLELSQQCARVFRVAIAERVPAISVETVEEFEREVAQKTADFGTPFQPGKTQPLDANPLLVSAAKVERVDDRLDVALVLTDGKRVTLHLADVWVRRLLELLTRVSRAAGWLGEPVVLEPSKIGSSAQTALN